MTRAQEGDTVKVHYTGRLTDGTVFDSSEGREPLTFKLGAGQVIPGFEGAVIGMAPGDRTTVDIPAADAYGGRLEERVLTVSRQVLPPDYTPEVGHELESRQENGHAIRAVISEVTETHVMLDTNHPLAGKDLTFDIELVEIEGAAA